MKKHLSHNSSARGHSDGIPFHFLSLPFFDPFQFLSIISFLLLPSKGITKQESLPFRNHGKGGALLVGLPASSSGHLPSPDSLRGGTLALQNAFGTPVLILLPLLPLITQLLEHAAFQWVLNFPWTKFPLIVQGKFSTTFTEFPQKNFPPSL